MSDQEIDLYYVDSAIGDDTVQHISPGRSIPGSRGIWNIVKFLPGGNGDDVQVQNLLYEPGVVGPPLYRAVKRIVRQKSPARDNSLMIKRSLLCMTRANHSVETETSKASNAIPVVRMLCWYHDAFYVYIAMEYCAIGNLRDWIHDYPFPGETWAREVTKQILSVLVELNCSQLAHRNIKPSNILIASALPIQIKVSDFHNAKWMAEDDGLRTQVSNLHYSAPEVRGEQDHAGRVTTEYNTSVDMWSLGIVLHEILSGSHPFGRPGNPRYSESRYQEYLGSDSGQISLSLLEGNTSQYGKTMVAYMLARDPAARPTPLEALGDQWFLKDIRPV